MRTMTALALTAALAACGNSSTSTATETTDSTSATDLTDSTDTTDTTEKTDETDNTDGTEECPPDTHVDCFGGADCSGGVITKYGYGPIYDCDATIGDCAVGGTYTCAEGCAKGNIGPEVTECQDGPIESCAKHLCNELQTTCGAKLGYDPTLLDDAAAEVLNTVGEPKDCGCIVQSNLGDDPDIGTQSACMCEAFASCTPAHLRIVMQTIEGDPVGTHLIIRQIKAGCEVVQLTDWSQDAFGGAEGVEPMTCTALVCEGPAPSPPWATGCTKH